LLRVGVSKPIASPSAPVMEVDAFTLFQSMIPKSGYRFSEKIMLKQ
jgi:hypothetical protein